MHTHNFWLKICVVNFFVVSFLGLFLRLNVVFTIPAFNQKFLLDAHSHFAFYGWISQCIYYFTGRFVSRCLNGSFNGYKLVLFTNLVASYGMLCSFFIGGYFWLSIIFSSIALFTGFFYAWLIYKDTKQKIFAGKIWLRAGAFFAVLSALGILGIALSVHKPALENLFRAFTYLYLHYQYNGFFIFSCIGLLVSEIKISGDALRQLNVSFFLLFFGCLFGYGLSILWLNIPVIWDMFFCAVSVIQLVAALYLFMVFKTYCSTMLSKYRSFIMVFSIAFLGKFVLQVVSCIPAFQSFIFGDRSAVIAYLHLVLLCGVTLFLLWLIIRHSPAVRFFDLACRAILVFVIFNQVLLFVQCFAFYFHFPLYNISFMLLVVSFLVSISALLASWSLLMSGSIDTTPKRDF